MNNFLLFLLAICALSRGLQDCGSGYESWADMCLDGSGSGSGDDEEVPWEGTLRTVCRETQLATWVPDILVEDKAAYSMVQDCSRLETLSDGTVPRCEIRHHGINVNEMSLLLPVTSQSTNVTYFNRYCFLCSGDSGPHVTWSINVSCTHWVELQSLATEREVLQAALDSGHCSMKLQPPSEVSAQRCHIHNSHISQGGASGPLPFPDKPQDLRPHRMKAPLSILLHFTDSGSSGDDRGGGGDSAREDAHCAGYVVHKLGERRCLTLNCAPGRRLEDTTCHPVIQRSEGLQYSLTLQLDVFVQRSDVNEQLTSESLSSLCSLNELVMAGVGQKADMLHCDAYNLTGWILARHSGVEPTTTITSDDDINIDDTTDVPKHEDFSFQNSAKEIPIGKVLVWFDFFTSDTDRRDVEHSALRVSKEDWHVICGQRHVRLVPSLRSRQSLNTAKPTDPTPTHCTLDSFTLSVTHPDPRVARARRQFVAITVSPFLQCPYVTFAEEEFTVSEVTTGQVKDNIVNLTLMNVTNTIPALQLDTDSAGNLKICSSMFEERFEELLKVRDDPSRDPYPDRASFWVLLEHYLSLVCVCVSLVCLLMTLVTYLAFRSLRTIPGQNTMGLCCNLFLAQALLQFGVNWTELQGGCIALGMLIHYFWLSSILWMNVCSFHMHRVFTAKRAARMTSTHVKCCTRRVAAYAVYAQGVPLVIIGTTISTTIFLTEGRQMGYGVSVCYLSSSLLVGAAFAAPLGLVLLMNLFFFLGSVREITNTETPVQTTCPNGHRSPSPHISHITPFPSTWRRNLNVCIRLSSLTGLFWALGLIAELMDQRILRLLSVLVNGSQGLLIAVSYLPTRRVLRLYSQACCQCRKRKQQSVSTTSTGSAPVANTMTITASTSALNISTDNNGSVPTSDI